MNWSCHFLRAWSWTACLVREPGRGKQPARCAQPLWGQNHSSLELPRCKQANQHGCIGSSFAPYAMYPIDKETVADRCSTRLRL